MRWPVNRVKLACGTQLKWDWNEGDLAWGTLLSWRGDRRRQSAKTNLR